MFEKFLLYIALPKKKFFEAAFLAAILTSLFLFVFLAYTTANVSTYSWDIEVTKNLQSISFLKNPMIIVSWFGEWIVSVILLLLIIGFLYLKGYRREATYMPIVLLTPALNSLVKELVARPRPTDSVINVVQTLPQYSFPSGHVMYYVVFFGFISFLAISLPKLEPRWRLFLLAISTPLIIFIGISRVYLGAHWPSDVLGAYLYGTLVLLIMILAYLKYVYRFQDVRVK